MKQTTKFSLKVWLTTELLAIAILGGYLIITGKNPTVEGLVLLMIMITIMSIPRTVVMFIICGTLFNGKTYSINNRFLLTFLAWSLMVIQSFMVWVLSIGNDNVIIEGCLELVIITFGIWFYRLKPIANENPITTL